MATSTAAALLLTTVAASAPVSQTSSASTNPSRLPRAPRARSYSRFTGWRAAWQIASIAVSGNQGEDFPFECSIDDGAWHTGRSWCETTYMWKASALCHKPLYFEDEALERYGHSWGPCLDPLVSGAHFFTKLPVLPYCMGVTPPCECVYTLGHYRPGSCAPYTIDPIPISCRGALFEAGAVVGTAVVLP